MRGFPPPTRIRTCRRTLSKRPGAKRFFRDVASGGVDFRRGLAEAIDYAREGDTPVVWKLDRLGRSLKHLIETVNGLAQMPMPPGFPGGSLRATSISCGRCGPSRFSRGSENPCRQPTRFQADPWYSLSTEGGPVGLWALSVILSSFRLPWPSCRERQKVGGML